MAKKFYVVFQGRNPGVYDSWPECQSQVLRFPGNSYKGYETYDEAISAFTEWMGGTKCIPTEGTSEMIRGETSYSAEENGKVRKANNDVVDAFIMGCLMGALMSSTSTQCKEAGDAEIESCSNISHISRKKKE